MEKNQTNWQMRILIEDLFNVRCWNVRVCALAFKLLIIIEIIAKGKDLSSWFENLVKILLS